jgi:hypothetical protein
MQKMTLADLKALYQPFEPHHQKAGRDGKLVRTHCTQKNHRHLVQPVWLPGVPFIRPSEYRRRHIADGFRAVPVASPSVQSRPAQVFKDMYIPTASTSGKQNDPKYRKQFGSRAAK